MRQEQFDDLERLCLVVRQPPERCDAIVIDQFRTLRLRRQYFTQSLNITPVCEPPNVSAEPAQEFDHLGVVAMASQPIGGEFQEVSMGSISAPRFDQQ